MQKVTLIHPLIHPHVALKWFVVLKVITTSAPSSLLSCLILYSCMVLVLSMVIFIDHMQDMVYSTTSHCPRNHSAQQQTKVLLEGQRWVIVSVLICLTP